MVLKETKPNKSLFVDMVWEEFLINTFMSVFRPSFLRKSKNTEGNMFLHDCGLEFNSNT